MGKRILVILGHPADASLCGALAEAYCTGAKAAGHEVRLLSLGQLRFDPVLHQSYTQAQPLEPDLVEAQAAIQWAQHLVLVYPLWWGAMPALLKGFIDRVFLPGFAFKFREGSRLWDRLLMGRTAHLIVTMDTPPWYHRWVARGLGHRLMKRNILGFAGIRPVKVTDFGPVTTSTSSQRERWLSQVEDLGRQD